MWPFIFFHARLACKITNKPQNRSRETVNRKIEGFSTVTCENMEPEIEVVINSSKKPRNRSLQRPQFSDTKKTSSSTQVIFTLLQLELSFALSRIDYHTPRPHCFHSVTYPAKAIHYWKMVVSPLGDDRYPWMRVSARRLECYTFLTTTSISHQIYSNSFATTSLNLRHQSCPLESPRR